MKELLAGKEVQVDGTGCLYKCIPLLVSFCFALWKISASLQGSHKAVSEKEGRKDENLIPYQTRNPLKKA